MRQPRILARQDAPKLHLINPECKARQMPMCGNNGICLYTEDEDSATCRRCLEGRRLKRYKEERS